MSFTVKAGARYLHIFDSSLEPSLSKNCPRPRSLIRANIVTKESAAAKTPNISASRYLAINIPQKALTILAKTVDIVRNIVFLKTTFLL